MDFLAATRAESQRFLEAVSDADFSAPVPSCPDWKVADLVWHLSEVQWFWSKIVDELRLDPKFPDLERPADEELVTLFSEMSERLTDALERQPDDAPCWSWAGGPQDVAWVKRRQAHEALIHRADAELGTGRTPVLDASLAADGIDEFIDWFMDGFEEWATFTPLGITIDLVYPEGQAAMELGRFQGTSPRGNEYDMDAFCRAKPGTGAATITADASSMDLWLWGRGDSVDIKGDEDLVTRFKAASKVE